MWYLSNLLMSLLIFNNSKIGAVSKLMIEGMLDMLDWPKCFVATAPTIFVGILT